MKRSVGLGLRHSFHNYVLENSPPVPWFEIITENYLFFDGRPRNFLHTIGEKYPLVFHGVSLSIGSLEPLRMNYLQQLKKMIQEFKPLWISDHLCWTYNGAENSHDLLPVPFTKESLDRIVSKVQQAQEYLGQKIYLENPSAYVDFAQNEFLEEDFISELCKRSGCGLLLDLNNLVVNQFNLGYQPLHYLEKIKNCEVRQIHLAGHTIKEQVRIDTHDNDISQDVLDLLPIAKYLWPEANPMIEWDDKIPEIGYLLEQRNKIDLIWNHHPAQKPTSTQKNPVSQQTTAGNDQRLHQSFWKLMKNIDYVTPEETKAAEIFNHNCPTPAYIGINVYSSAYYARIIEVLEKDFPVLKTALNELFADVMMEYLNSYPSTFDSIDFVGNNLAKFISEHSFKYSLGVDPKIISDIAAFENISGLSSIAFSERNPALSVKDMTEDDWVHQKIKLNPAVLLYKANSEIHHVVDAVKNKETPEIPDLKNCYYLFYREVDETHFRVISGEEFTFLSQFREPVTFVATINETENDIQQKYKLLMNNEKFFNLTEK